MIESSSFSPLLTKRVVTPSTCSSKSPPSLSTSSQRNSHHSFSHRCSRESLRRAKAQEFRRVRKSYVHLRRHQQQSRPTPDNQLNSLHHQQEGGAKNLTPPPLFCVLFLLMHPSHIRSYFEPIGHRKWMESTPSEYLRKPASYFGISEPTSCNGGIIVHYFGAGL